ncbi:regulator of volume decrease after cellular swelling-domain-containing protein [Epithele typhae]|uniref:regulator of volume decrease after cellular swelling-domain-containing protein n=1 Tax=Epithele typhae TaxID=378194 RepID=UPI0020080BB2|nr:regulator of volume decrease after cellular swelling-domain-containing protein [Epithele typhae]KAH9945498.1 regulator of volume decrease after cellular swelling-domain-containing protein [Epithele typhae]
MPITVVSALPAHISPEEHRIASASTPASFADIPPVLRHKQSDVSVTLDPPLDGFSTENGTRGDLYVIESALFFMSASGTGIQVDYPTITLHAISRAENGPSIYCQLDEPTSAEEAEEDEDTSSMRELVIIPKDPSALEPIFESLSLCASLHPDPNEGDEMDDDDDAFVDPGLFETFDGDGDQELSEVGKVRSDFVNDSRFNPY